MQTNSRRPRARFVPGWFVAALAVAVSFALYACTPGDEVSVQESDVVATMYNPNVDFSAIDTYAMPDTIHHLKADEDDPDEISRKYDEDILNLIAANLDARGFQRVDESGSPDVVVLVSATEITNWYAYSYYPGGWWGYGWGWYYPYYPYYPTWGVSYAYTTGTLFADMVEPEGSDTTHANYWRGVCNGVLDDVESSKVKRFTDSINQMFVQSPYLQSAD